MNDGHINRKWLSITLIVGVGSLLAGASIGEWSRGSISGLLIEIGGGAVLFAIGIILQPLILRKIGTATQEVASATARSVTDDLSRRISRLEDIKEEQVQGRHQREQEVSEVLANLRSDVSVESVGHALMEAYKYRLLSPGGFRVRTSDKLDGPELRFLPLAEPGKVVLLWMSFVPMNLVPQELGGEVMDLPENSDGVVLWKHGDMSAGQIAARLESELIKLNHSAMSEFSFSYAIERLIQSIDVMFRSRNAAYRSGLKIEGPLIVLINDEWVLTSRGLESVHLETVVDYWPVRSSEADLVCPAGASPRLWEEASQYFRHWGNR